MDRLLDKQSRKTRANFVNPSRFETPDDPIQDFGIHGIKVTIS
jgi:hypothetical protein